VTSAGAGAAGSVSVAGTANGSVSADKSSPAAGDTVTVTVRPNPGYQLGGLIVRDAGGSAVMYTDMGGGVYRFTYGGSPVTVTAAFTPLGSAAPEGSLSADGNPFTDVAPADWFYGTVLYAYKNGLLAGVSANEFAPLETTTRAMAVTVLCRLEGAPAATGVNRFTDLRQDWYKNSVQWAVDNGITGGTGATTFEPDTAATREQLAALLYRYAQYKGYDVSARADLSGYADAGAISDWALDAMRWANAAGLITGETETVLNPAGASTRAVFATIMARFREYSFIPAAA
jgi:hypothetical protein